MTDKTGFAKDRPVELLEDELDGVVGGHTVSTKDVAPKGSEPEKEGWLFEGCYKLKEGDAETEKLGSESRCTEAGTAGKKLV